MDKHIYREGSMKSIIDQLVEKLGGSYHNQIFSINTDVVKGKAKYFQLLPGIKFSINNFEYQKDTYYYFEGDNNQSRHICYRFTYSGDVVKGKVKEHPEEKLSGGMTVFDSVVSTELIMRAGIPQKWVGVRVHKDIMDNEEHLLKNFFGDVFTKDKPWLLYDTIPLEIHILLKEIFEMNTTKPPIVQNTLLVAKSSEMLSIFFDRLLSRNHKPQTGLHSEDFDNLMVIKDHILASLDEVPSLTELAEMYGFSVSKLRRDFTQVFGTSITQFHINYRLEKAKIMLATESNNIQYVSRACGFKSNSKFSHYFKKKYNLRPKELAKKYQHLNQ